MKWIKIGLILLSIHLHGNLSEKALPSELTYKGKPIPDYSSFRFFWDPGPVHLEDKATEFNIDYQWEYIGSFHEKYHLIKMYYWEEGCIGKFTNLLLVKRVGDSFEISDVIYGGDRHASMIFSAEVCGDKVTYEQGATTGGLIDYAGDLFPDIKPLLARSLLIGCYGEACFTGSYTFTNHVTPEGKFTDRTLLSFEACEGEPYHGKKYSKEELKTFVLDLLFEFDQDKPEELKEKGVAFSPVCFYSLLQDDLEDKDALPRMINFLSDKNKPAFHAPRFHWDYIGKINQFHVISASDGSAFGIYTLYREGNHLIKMGRIFHQKKAEASTPFEIKVEGNSVVFFQKVSSKSLFDLFCEKYPELKSKAEDKVWSEAHEDLCCGLAKIDMRISDVGWLDKKTFAGFMSYGDSLREEREQAAQKKALLPMDKALLFTGIEMSSPYEFDRLLSEKQLLDFFQKVLERASTKK